jgi:hypothetical protein
VTAGVRRWSALGLLLVGPLAAVLVALLHPGPSGHWSGHLASAAMSTGVAIAVAAGAALVWSRLPWPAIPALAITIAGLAMEAVGNVRAARSLWETSYDDAQAALYGPSHPGYEWGHTVAEWGDSLVILGSLALVVVLGASRRVGVVVAIVCGVLAFFPPWIYPSLGTIVILAWLRARPRSAEQRLPDVLPVADAGRYGEQG